jgi:hypothetical protein
MDVRPPTPGGDELSRRKSFDTNAIDPRFWHGSEVQRALARRDIATLLAAFMVCHPDCTQTRLAQLIDHDRSDVSHWVNGQRQACVSDIEVLARIADGLLMPDASRVLLGLAPAQAPMSAFATTSAHGASGTASAVEVAICGSRRGDVNAEAVDAVVAPLARLVLREGWKVHHGPVGLGIEIMTYMADRYRPPGAEAAIGRYGHHNVVAQARWVLVLGGGRGTATEIDHATALGKRIIPLAASGGAAARFATEAARDPALRSWMCEEDFHALISCAAEDYPRHVLHLTRSDTEGASSP